MKCRECGRTGARDNTWGLCSRCFKVAKKISPLRRKNIRKKVYGI